jgi:hypothetical protein
MPDESRLGDIIGVFIFCTLYLAGTVWVLLWVTRDAEARGKSGCIVAFLVFLLQIPGLLLWLVFRPEKKSGIREQL